MKNKDSKWLDDKIQDIKKRKRALRHVQDSFIVKKMKNDLKREHRSAKRAERNSLKNWIKKEIENGKD